MDEPMTTRWGNLKALKHVSALERQTLANPEMDKSGSLFTQKS